MAHLETSYGWEPAEVKTQTSKLSSSTNRIISVLIADETLSSPVLVKPANRSAVYDGVIEFSDGLTLIIENKPSIENVWDEQLSPSKKSLEVFEEEISLGQYVVSLKWSEILEGMLQLSDSTSATFAVREMAEDFFALVADLFPKLSPYRTFRLCGNRAEALRKRIFSLLGEISEQTKLTREKRSGGVFYLARPHCLAQEVRLELVGETHSDFSLRLALWPANTVSQTRDFFADVDKEAFLGLRNCGWTIRPNFHFSHIQKQLVWAETKMPVEEYFEWVASDPNRIGGGEFTESSLEPLLESWLKQELITQETKRELTTHFINTKRTRMNVIPGFMVFQDIPLEEVIKLENEGNLEARLLEILSQPFPTWGEEFIQTSAS